MATTPLYKKLGIKNDAVILVLNAPKNYTAFFFDFPNNVIIHKECGKEKIEFIHIFVRTKQELEHYFFLGKSHLKKNGFLWVSWPKKSAKITSELNKFDIMEYGLNHGLVDTKVASIDADWSGHKFVYRLKDR